MPVSGGFLERFDVTGEAKSPYSPLLRAARKNVNLSGTVRRRPEDGRGGIRLQRKTGPRNFLLNPVVFPPRGGPRGVHAESIRGREPKKCYLFRNQRRASPEAPVAGRALPRGPAAGAAFVANSSLASVGEQFGASEGADPKVAIKGMLTLCKLPTARKRMATPVSSQLENCPRAASSAGSPP